MEWSNETILQFLEAYHAEVVLWDPTHEHHKDKRKLQDAWCRLSTDLNRPVADLKKKNLINGNISRTPQEKEGIYKTWSWSGRHIQTSVVRF